MADSFLAAAGCIGCQKLATVLPEGLNNVCQSVYLGVSDGKIAAYTDEAADIARKATLIQLGRAAGDFAKPYH